MKTLMTTTALLVTMSTAAFAGPVSTAICAGHNDVSMCEDAIAALEGNYELYENQNRAIYDAGYGSLEALIEAADTPVKVIVEVPTIETVTVEVEVDADDSDLISAWANGKEEGYTAGVAAGAAEAQSFGFDQGYVAGIDASQDLVAEARADLAAVEAGIDAAIAEGIAAIDVDKIAHEARKEAIEAIAAPIYDHKQRAGDMFRNNPVAWMTFAIGYIEDLQSQLGMR